MKQTLSSLAVLVVSLLAPWNPEDPNMLNDGRSADGMYNDPHHNRRDYDPALPITQFQENKQIETNNKHTNEQRSSDGF